jgi:hypothetical protein
MKNLLQIIGIVGLILSFAGMVGATSYTFTPGTTADGNRDLWDLDHGKAYTWGVNWTIPTNQKIVGASVFFDDIRNWQTEVNDLWLQLLDTAAVGAKELTDSESGQINYFRNQGLELNKWHNISATASDITYTFDQNELNTLTSYILNNGNFGLGFDPDCHFYNNGIKLTIETAAIPTAVPEPTTLVLMGLGMIGVVALKRQTR